MNVEIYRDYGVVDLGEIESYEQEVGYKFPSAYKKILSQHNALWPEERNFDYTLSQQKNTGDVIFWGFGEQLKKSIRIQRFQLGEYFNEGLVVIGGTAGGDYVCFDYRANSETDNPPVALMLHDYSDGNDEMMVCPIAGDFESFIDSLYKPENN